MSRTADDDETIRKRSGWLIPLGVFFVTFVLSAMFLLYYLAPSAPSLFEEQVVPTSRSDIIALKVRNLALYIPANYLEYEKARQGGTQHEVALFAILPDLTGWSNWDAQTFAGNGPKSPVVYMLIYEDKFELSEAERLRRVYMGYVADKRGVPGPFGLTRYAFRNDSGYRNEDLYVGGTPRRPIVLRCVRLGPQVPSPNCLRDMAVANGVSLSYRFKRAHLFRWRAIADGVDKLVAAFEKPPK
ncbi:MAG: hypothetical protein KGJ79_06010 [Alphaproteobacteria bacterium]|nr:hypothetical protein [Alphaproteobacteria bacterium]MDE2110676.1 hypothetical protein [Alphaproteobacteria bacterium]MDE2494481.1 hypothetical protein [Alphaproteobacteria bacterium]